MFLKQTCCFQTILSLHFSHVQLHINEPPPGLGYLFPEESITERNPLGWFLLAPFCPHLFPRSALFTPSSPKQPPHPFPPHLPPVLGELNQFITLSDLCDSPSQWAEISNGAALSPANLAKQATSERLTPSMPAIEIGKLVLLLFGRTDFFKMLPIYSLPIEICI